MPCTQERPQDGRLPRDQGDRQQQGQSQQQPSQQDCDVHSRLLQRLAGRSSCVHHTAGSPKQPLSDAADSQHQHQQQQALQQQQQAMQQQAVQQLAAQQLQEQDKQQQVMTQLHKEQQQKEQQLMELQHQTEQLIIENAALRAAQAEAEALRDRVQRMQEAEQLKQVRDRAQAGIRATWGSKDGLW